MNNLLHNIRFYILVLALIFSAAITISILFIIPSGSYQIILLDQTFALVAFCYIYITLLAGPFCYAFRSFPYRKQYLRARRALGVSAFYFSLLHSSIAFFSQLDGFTGLSFLSSKYLLALSIGLAALFILFLLTMTSFDATVSLLSFPKWKLLHRTLYLAGMLIVIHTVLLGTHFDNLTNARTQITFFAIVFLLLLEIPRLDKTLEKLSITIPKLKLTSVLFLAFAIFAYVSLLNQIATTNNPLSFSIHAAHTQLAQLANQNQFINRNTNNLPGLNGDRNKRYTVSYNNPTDIEANLDTKLQFKIYDAENGSQISFLRLLYSKPMHCIIVDNQLQYFNHIHPVQVGNEFIVTTQFPHDGIYHIYISFQPFGGIEQQVGFTQTVGQSDTIDSARQPPDKNPTKVFGSYAVNIDTHGTLQANTMSLGEQTISFTLKDAKTQKLISTLKPYLAAFGHLTMINEQNYNFIHVHPYSLTIPATNADSGPTVDFLPIGIYGPFKPGIYRAFAEFNPDNHLFTADFTITVE